MKPAQRQQSNRLEQNSEVRPHRDSNRWLSYLEGRACLLHQCGPMEQLRPHCGLRWSDVMEWSWPSHQPIQWAYSSPRLPLWTGSAAARNHQLSRPTLFQTLVAPCEPQLALAADCNRPNRSSQLCLAPPGVERNWCRRFRGFDLPDRLKLAPGHFSRCCFLVDSQSGPAPDWAPVEAQRLDHRFGRAMRLERTGRQLHQAPLTRQQRK